MTDTMIQVTKGDRLPVESGGDYLKQLLAEIRVLNIQILALRGSNDDLNSLRTNEINSIQ